MSRHRESVEMAEALGIAYWEAFSLLRMLEQAERDELWSEASE